MHLLNYTIPAPFTGAFLNLGLRSFLRENHLPLLQHLKE